MALNHLVKLFGVFMVSAVANFFENSISLVQTLHQSKQCLHKSCFNQTLVFNISFFRRSSILSSLIGMDTHPSGSQQWSQWTQCLPHSHSTASVTWAKKKKKIENLSNSDNKQIIVSNLIGGHGQR